MPELDRRNLENEFNMTEDIPLEPEIVDDEENDEFEKEYEDENSPKNILLQNIERANSILDRVEEEMENGNFSARLVEVAGQLINAISNNASTIQSGTYNKEYLQVRQKLVELKEKEVEIKQNKLKKPTNQNLIIADRESVLKFLSEEKEKRKEITDGN